MDSSKNLNTSLSILMPKFLTKRKRMDSVKSNPLHRHHPKRPHPQSLRRRRHPQKHQRPQKPETLANTSVH
ncbi:hypothetical protein V6N12_021216 [Hibiscus sabdariffa]|uniref:Uncharacterized protein n=1 Tax=Hibiscus sabdariffa TaxID=183260 RepID=A0ABR2FR81_9ROSI